ncbi:hypothetical protein DPMN_046460 [Dreissena polymorpha]|uniref:Uncharacterized protein n=1 Tax=Dreissena polymorpha TaxID=45954 RepID=A0A9D4D9L8_DREPO|nr:hypothetical protein DPMN_046460 [Dreissena polymorpha]
MFKTDQNANKRGVWNQKTVIDVKLIFESADSLKNLLDTDLKILVRYLRKAGYVHLKESTNKARKLKSICEILGLEHVDTNIDSGRKRTNVKTTTAKVQRLCDIAIAEVSKLRKTDLNIIYAEYIWPERLFDWRQRAPMLGSDLYLQESDEMCTSTFSTIKDFCYIPSHNISRNQLEVSCIQSSYDTIKEKMLQGRVR